MMSVEKYEISPLADTSKNTDDFHPDAFMKGPPDWLGEDGTGDRLQACVDAAIREITTDPTLRVPRTLQEREHGFSGWLRSWEVKVGPVIEEQFGREFPGIHGRVPRETIRQVVSQHVWPPIERFLLSYAIRGLSRSWISRNIGDAIVLREPEWTGAGWKVPLGVSGRPGDVGVVALDGNGTIVPEETSTRDAILTRLHA